MASQAQVYPRFSFGKTVSDMFGTIGRNFLLLCGLALLLYGLPSAIFVAFFMNWWMAVFSGAGVMDGADAFNFDWFGALGPGVATLGLGTVLFSIYTQGAMLSAVLDDLDGERPTFGAAMRGGLRYFLPILGITLIVYIALGAIVALPAMLAFGAGAVGIAIALFLLVIIPLVFFVIIVVLVAVPAAVAEDIGPVEAVSRSIELTAGHRWKLFAMILIYGFVSMIVSSAISGVTMPFMAIGGGDPASAFGQLTPILAVQTFLGALTLVITYPALAATYHNLRIAKEGVKHERVADIFE